MNTQPQATRQIPESELARLAQRYGDFHPPIALQMFAGFAYTDQLAMLLSVVFINGMTTLH